MDHRVQKRARRLSSGTNYYHQDHMSNRIVTNSSGSVVAEMGHFPFGESWYNATNDKLYFTTYEYDSESGNHYAMARYHASRLGRLSSPDPLAGSTADPQSLNRYSYSINDPANVTDPSGAAGCNTVEKQPTDKSQQASGGGHSDTGNSDADTDADDADADPPPQNGCVSHVNPWGGGGFSLDGGYFGDDSGELPNGGFQVGGGDLASQIALMNVPIVASASWGIVNWDNVTCGDGACNEFPNYGYINGDVPVGTGWDLFGLGPQPSGPDGAPTSSDISNGKKAAQQLLKNPDCSKFVQQTLNAIAPSKHYTVAQLSQGIQGEQVSYSAKQLYPNAAALATPPHHVTLLPLFNTLTSGEQASEVFVHEAFHLSPFRFTDGQLAGSILPGLARLPTGDASATFNNFLVANCK